MPRSRSWASVPERDDDGYLYIVDRIKDVIVSGGENIANPEIERVLYEHEPVLEASVVRRPVDQSGEVPSPTWPCAPSRPPRPIS